MTVRTRQFLVVAVLAGVFGVGIAVAGGDLDEQQGRVPERRRGRLSVTRAKLETAIKGASDDRVDAALADGRITKDQADAMKARATEGGLPLLGPGIAASLRSGMASTRARTASAPRSTPPPTYLGLTEAQLRTQIESGKSLADIAKEQGKSVDGLKQAITADLTTKLDAAVKDGKLTKAQADEINSSRRTTDSTTSSTASSAFTGMTAALASAARR